MSLIESRLPKLAHRITENINIKLNDRSLKIRQCRLESHESIRLTLFAVSNGTHPQKRRQQPRRDNRRYSSSKYVKENARTDLFGHFWSKFHSRSRSIRSINDEEDNCLAAKKAAGLAGRRTRRAGTKWLFSADCSPIKNRIPRQGAADNLNLRSVRIHSHPHLSLLSTFTSPLAEVPLRAAAQRTRRQKIKRHRTNSIVLFDGRIGSTAAEEQRNGRDY